MHLAMLFEDALLDVSKELIDAFDDVSVADVSAVVDGTGEVVVSDMADFATQEERVAHYHLTCWGKTRTLIDEVAFFFIVGERDQALHTSHAHVWISFEMRGPLVDLRSGAVEAVVVVLDVVVGLVHGVVAVRAGLGGGEGELGGVEGGRDIAGPGGRQTSKAGRSV